MCEKFSISRQTARQAIAILEKEGLVLNIAAGNATSFDVQNIDGGNATTVDPYKLDAGNALSILN